MNVGKALLELTRRQGARTLFVVGTGKNVGKTVAMRAAYEAAYGDGLRVGVASTGRDGPAIETDALRAKPRLRLRAQTLFVTARTLLPRSPACEIIELTQLQSASGPLLYARSAADALYELVGPPTASGMREIVDALNAHSEMTIVDGAIDRLAALAGSDGAIVVACSAGAAGTMQEAVDDVAALVTRLRVARYDPNESAVGIDGALTAARAAEFIAADERRQIVVHDPTQVTLTGRAALRAFERLRIRCRRPLHVIAATIASQDTNRTFEPRRFAEMVAAATQLPTFDVYAGASAA